MPLSQSTAREGQTILRSGAFVNYMLVNDEFHSIGTLLTNIYRDTDNAARLPCSFTVAINGTVLTVSAVASGTLAIGQTIQGAGILFPEPMISNFITGSGGIGTYELNEDKGIIAAQPMTGDGVIVLPLWSNFCIVEAHVTFPAQINGDGYCSAHLFRNSHPTPVPLGGADMAYHNRIFYSVNNLSYTSFTAITDKIPVIFPGESWSLPARQTSGATQNVGGFAYNGETWLSVRYFDR